MNTWRATARASRSRSGFIRLGPRVRASLALWQQAERLRIDSDRRSPAVAKRLGMMGAASVQWEASAIFHLFALGALDCEGTGENGSVSACGALEPSARLGVSVALGSDARLYANIGRYVRVPTLGELFGLSSALRGSPSLVPETGISADLGARWEARWATLSTRAYLDAFVFSRFASQLIAYRRSSFRAVTPYNVGTARVPGREMALGTETLHALRAELSLTLLDPRDQTDGRVMPNDLLPYRARLTATPRIEVFAEPALPALALDRVSLGVKLSYRSSEYSDLAGRVVIPAQTLVDLEARAWFWDKRITAMARLANLFDEDTRDVIYYPLPPRSVHGSVELAW